MISPEVLEGEVAVPAAEQVDVVAEEDGALLAARHRNPPTVSTDNRFQMNTHGAGNR